MNIRIRKDKIKVSLEKEKFSSFHYILDSTTRNSRLAKESDNISM